MKELTRYYGHMVQLYRHYYDKRSGFLAAYVTGVSITSVAIFKDPELPALCIILIFISLLALFLDLYLHKRVMISAAILRRIEEKIGLLYTLPSPTRTNNNDVTANSVSDVGVVAVSLSQTQSRTKNTIGIMSQILTSRWDSSFTSRTGGRYFLTYGIGTITISLAIYGLFLKILLDENSLQNYGHIMMFSGFFILYLVVLYRVILKAKSYEHILKDLPKFHHEEKLYNDYLPYLSLEVRQYYYERCHYGSDDSTKIKKEKCHPKIASRSKDKKKRLAKANDRYREGIINILEKFEDPNDCDFVIIGNLKKDKKNVNKKIKEELDLTATEKFDVFFWWAGIFLLSIMLMYVPTLIYASQHIR